MLLVKKRFDFSASGSKILHMTEDKLLTKNEVIEYLRISRGTLERKLMKEIPFFKMGKRVLFRQSDIEAYLEKIKTIKK